MRAGLLPSTSHEEGPAASCTSVIPHHPINHRQTMCRPRRRGGCVWPVVEPMPKLPWSLVSLPPRPKSLAESWHPAQQTQAAFYKLPTELRQLVLREAFGGRTLHLDVRSRNSLHTLSMSAPGDIFETYRPAARGWRRLVPWFWPKSYRHTIHTSESLEELPAWKWYGCFCHRGRVVWSDALWVWHCDALAPLFSDGCWRGGPWCCKRDDVEARVPDDARVAAIGFLLSCKRA
jgi:hypothetical protein